MFRKLHNSLNALLLASTACIVGALVLAALPAGPAAAQSHAQAAQPAAIAVTADADVDAPKPRKVGPHLRRVTAMPYFSFLPRG